LVASAAALTAKTQKKEGRMAQLVKRRVVNPAPAVLALVNPKKRGKKMATKKRRSTKRRVHHARAHNPINPTRRHKSTKRRTTKRRVYASRRNPVNPTHRRSRKRYSRRRHSFLRNPLGAGGEVLDFAGAGIGLGLFQPLVGRFIGGYLPFGQYNGAALTAISGWGLSKILEMFGFTRRFAKPARILGYSTAVIQIVQPIVARAIAGVGAAPANGMNGRYRRGMNGIGVMTSIPPGINALPPVPGNNNGMQGVGVMTAIPPGMPR
jgi:hypothetical protein